MTTKNAVNWLKKNQFQSWSLFNRTFHPISRSYDIRNKKTTFLNYSFYNNQSYSTDSKDSNETYRAESMQKNEKIAQDIHNTQNKLTWNQIAEIARQQEEEFFKKKSNSIPDYQRINVVEVLDGPQRIFFEGVLHFLDRKDLEMAEETLNKAKAYDPQKAASLEPIFMILQGLIAMEKGNFVGGRAGIEHGLTMIGNRVSFDNARIVIIAHRELSRFYKDKFIPKNPNEQKDRPNKVVQHGNRAFMLSEEYFGWKDKLTTDLALEGARADFSFSRVDIGIMLLEKTLVAIEISDHLKYDLETLTDIGTMLARAYDRRKYFKMGESAIKRVTNMILKRKEEFTDLIRLEQCLFKLDNRRTIARFMNDHDHVSLRKFKQLDEKAHIIGTEWINSNPYEALFEIALMKYFKGYALCTIVLRGNKSQNQIKDQKLEFIQDKAKSKEMLTESIVAFEGAKVLFEQLEDKHWISECDSIIEQMKDELSNL